MSDGVRVSGVPPQWHQPLLAVVVVLAVILALFRQTVSGMASVWSSTETYTHGYIVPVISLWLIWRIRDTLSALQPKPARSAWGLMLMVSVLWLLGDLVAVNATTHFALVALLVLSVPAVLGWQVAKAMTFPLAFMFFAVPFGDFLLPHLMELTADFTVLALRWSGIPVYREGLHFIIPSGAWSVVEACSGIRYLIASFMVGCLFAYLSYSSTRKRVAFMIVSLLVPLVANWMRAYLIVLIGHLSGNELATGVDHLVYGWVFFGFVILIMLWIGARWADPENTKSLAASAATASRAGAGVGASGWPLWSSVVVVAVVALFPHALASALQNRVSSQAVVQAPLAARLPWQVSSSPPVAFKPAFNAASADMQMGFVDQSGDAVGVHISYYRQQNYERKLVTSSNELVSSQDDHWARVSAGVHDTVIEGQPLRVGTALLRKQGNALTGESQPLLVWRFYWVNDRFTASDVEAKLLGAWGLLRGWGDDGAIVVLYTPLPVGMPESESVEKGSAVLQAFLQSQSAALEASLHDTRGER